VGKPKFVFHREFSWAATPLPNTQVIRPRRSLAANLDYMCGLNAAKTFMAMTGYPDDESFAKAAPNVKAVLTYIQYNTIHRCDLRPGVDINRFLLLLADGFGHRLKLGMFAPEFPISTIAYVDHGVSEWLKVNRNPPLSS
jgi:hypothetical protein